MIKMSQERDLYFCPKCGNKTVDFSPRCMSETNWCEYQCWKCFTRFEVNHWGNFENENE